MSKEYVVQLETGVWLAGWTGDPGRTCEIDNAIRFNTIWAAAVALNRSRDYRPFPKAFIHDPTDPHCNECGGRGFVERFGVSAIDYRNHPCPECNKPKEMKNEHD